MAKHRTDVCAITGEHRSGDARRTHCHDEMGAYQVNIPSSLLIHVGCVDQFVEAETRGQRFGRAPEHPAASLTKAPSVDQGGSVP